MTNPNDKKIKILISNFNNYTNILATFIANTSPNSNMKMYKGEIERLVDEGSKVMIDTFTLNVLRYEEQIMEGDEAFFVGNNYSDITQNDRNMVNRMFEFKSIWKILTENNKNVIIKYMQLLCQISRAYFEIVVENKIN
ncbi:MAG: hypothetical protein Terrestrivirus3_21 [Terrestrivirus sp.]|uniref:Uncharacterized protein n=1 Tax=Terrestrivirus sp. TaxID=2487775 RepID=A0A3G4ZLM7_9VIRU|nr:MAG: hypothetical protein Terrestrivirus3_21 [Terrestrivirus sp.]